MSLCSPGDGRKLTIAVCPAARHRLRVLLADLELAGHEVSEQYLVDMLIHLSDAEALGAALAKAPKPKRKR